MNVAFLVNDLQLSGGVGVVVEHARLADAAARDRAKAAWRERLGALEGYAGKN